MAFRLPIDIANRTLQNLGLNHIASLTAGSHGASEVSEAYDALRLVELQRNLWKFATRRVILRAIGIDTVLWTPPVWVQGTVASPVAYSAGAVVSYTPASGPYADQAVYWQLSIAEVNSTVSPDLDVLWKHYTGPLAIDLFDETATYQTGEVVLVPAAWDSVTTYVLNNVVAYAGSGVWQWFVSTNAANLNNPPTTSPDDWVLWTGQGRGNGSYGQTATGSPIPLIYAGAYSVYLSLYNNNMDNPLDAPGNWLFVSAVVSALRIAWPIGAGPVTDAATNNVFYLPNGFLKRAPSYPHANQPGYLGAASGVPPDDWTPEGPLLVTGDSGPLMLRFIADVTDVSEMDPMFCEGLAARGALELALTLVEGKSAMAVRAAAGQSYRRIMTEARTTNAIEIGPISPVENRFVTVRV